MSRQEFQVIRRVAGGPASLWELIESCDGTILDIYGAIEGLMAAGSLTLRDGAFTLSEQGRASHGSWIREEFTAELRRYRELMRGAPAADSAYFQQRMRPEDLFRMMRFIYDRGDLAGRRLFILGDDDCFSIAAALTGLPARVTTVEIDARITAFIRMQAQALGLQIEVARYNAADPLPRELVGRFDTFVTDPVETAKGFTATLSRGMAALRHPGAMYFTLTEIECPPGRWHRFQAMLNRAGFILTDILRNHTHYVDDPGIDPSSFPLLTRAPCAVRGLPNYHWYRSSFTRLVSVRPPRPPIRGRVRFDRSFYRDEYVMTV
jgi:predicted methyltransferase